MAVRKWTISFMPEVAEDLERRFDVDGERSMRVNQQLERYFAIMENCRRHLRSILSEKEIGLVLDALNGTLHDTYSIPLAWAGVADAIELDGLDRKWGVDGAALVEKLKGLDYAQACALVDAVEIWWNRIGAGEQPQPGWGEALEPKRKTSLHPTE